MSDLITSGSVFIAVGTIVTIICCLTICFVCTVYGICNSAFCPENDEEIYGTPTPSPFITSERSRVQTIDETIPSVMYNNRDGSL